MNKNWNLEARMEVGFLFQVQCGKVAKFKTRRNDIWGAKESKSNALQLQETVFEVTAARLLKMSFLNVLEGPQPVI